jgi:hypothetical protein
MPRQSSIYLKKRTTSYQASLGKIPLPMTEGVHAFTPVVVIFYFLCIGKIRSEDATKRLQKKCEDYTA